MSITSYRRDLRAIARGYWMGLWNDAQFNDLMFSAIDRGLEAAWFEGAKKVGILPDEITPTEQVALATIVFKEYAMVPGLATFIFQNNRDRSKLAGKNLHTVYSKIINRIELWVNRYKDVVNRAKVESGKDPKLKWVLGPTKNHCSTCGKLSGKVKRASWWRDNVMPQQPPNDALECKGWKCGCNLEPTDEPVSKGRMPNVP